VEALAQQLIFSLAVGNLDQHAKNLGLLHFPDERIELTPTYDNTPTALYAEAYPELKLTKKLALSVGGEYHYANLAARHIVRELVSWKSRAFTDADSAREFVVGEFKRVESVLTEDESISGMQEGLVEFISSSSQRLSE
jgi:serine/threonine-protein kinase HipA